MMPHLESCFAFGKVGVVHTGDCPTLQDLKDMVVKRGEKIEAMAGEIKDLKAEIFDLERRSW